MNNIHILDCTLRDGGYCNEWKFGFENSKKIIEGLIEANIDIIECGFITNTTTYDPEVTKFTTLDEIARIIPENKNGKKIVAMMNYGEYDIDDLPYYDGKTIDGIRVAFHKQNRFEALEMCKRIKDKGYLVFVQAMVSLSYTDKEFLETIQIVNGIKPYSFYIVDSFGMMKGKDLIRLFYMVEHNLDPEIWIGFHSHNNLQLAYSNAQNLATIQTNRDLIIDSSVYGMGRGAGNLNTELFVEYLNDNAGKKYKIKPILCLIDEIIDGFYRKNYWGYSLPNYISATHNAHPNYAGFLADKNTLTIENMNDIFDMMVEEKKKAFDKNYIENLYLNFMENGRVQEEHKVELQHRLQGRSVLLIAPGKSSVDEKEAIKRCSQTNNTVIISVNYEYKELDTDYIFLSNNRRLRELRETALNKCIITSNVPAEGAYLQTDYMELLSSVEAVSDNAGLMAVRFLIKNGVSRVYLAGFDGYSHDIGENYGEDKMAISTRNSVLDAMNQGMSIILKELSKSIDIEFVTKPKHIDIS